MSSFTSCNYCSLKGIKRRAKTDGMNVRATPSRWHTGVNVYVVPKDIAVPKPIVEDSEFHEKYFTAWFMEVTDTCAC